MPLSILGLRLGHTTPNYHYVRPDYASPNVSLAYSEEMILERQNVTTVAGSNFKQEVTLPYHHHREGLRIPSPGRLYLPKEPALTQHASLP